MVMLRPSSNRRTFSSRVPNSVSMLGLIPMLFFMRVGSKRCAFGSERQGCRSAVPPAGNTLAPVPLLTRNKTLLGDGINRNADAPRASHYHSIESVPRAKRHVNKRKSSGFGWSYIPRGGRHRPGSGPFPQGSDFLGPGYGKRNCLGQSVNQQLCAQSEEHTSELQSHSFISYAVFR